MVRLRDRKPTHLEETYEFMKDAAHRHGKRFDLSFDEWLPVWMKLDESWNQKKKEIKLGVING